MYCQISKLVTWVLGNRFFKNYDYIFHRKMSKEKNHILCSRFRELHSVVPFSDFMT